MQFSDYSLSVFGIMSGCSIHPMSHSTYLLWYSAYVVQSTICSCHKSLCLQNVSLLSCDPYFWLAWQARQFKRFTSAHRTGVVHQLKRKITRLYSLALLIEDSCHCEPGWVGVGRLYLLTVFMSGTQACSVSTDSAQTGCCGCLAQWLKDNMTTTQGEVST